MHAPLQLRHPNILSFKETLELEEKGVTVIYVVTEAVTPLADRLHQLDMSGPARCVCRLTCPRGQCHCLLHKHAACLKVSAIIVKRCNSRLPGSGCSCSRPLQKHPP